MAKGGRGGVSNGPSTTGNPSGKGRGNNPSRSSSFGGDGGGGGGGGTITISNISEPEEPASIELRGGEFHDAARAIRTAYETLPEEEALAVEIEIRSKLTHMQCKLVDINLRKEESAFSKLRRGKL